MKLADFVGLIAQRMKAQGFNVDVNYRLGYLVFSDSEGAEVFIQGDDFNDVLSQFEKLENNPTLSEISFDDVWLFILEPYAVLFEEQ